VAVDFDQDVLAKIMDPSVFGEGVQPNYRPQAGAPFNIDGVFDRAYKGLVINADGEPEIATRTPTLGVRLAQFAAAPVKGDKVYVPSVPETYMVAAIHPDGKGWARLDLNIAAP
jgi:hypothetical protein